MTRTPLAFSNLNIHKTEKEVEKKKMKKQKIHLFVHLKINFIKDHIKEIYANIT
jgi:hypothetical protein